MDSTNGGIPSPVLEDENGVQQFFPIPIPCQEQYATTKFEDLTIMGQNLRTSYMKDVKPSYRGSEYFYFNPDLRKDYLPNRHPEWKSTFGQVGKAQSHLQYHEIISGDVFLFYGWFQFAEWKEGKFRFKRDKYPNGFHAIYGYLQVGKIYDNENWTTPEWLADHPHVKMKEQGPFKDSNNTVYVAKDYMCFFTERQSSQPGAGCFAFNKQLILTEPGQANRRMWRLPACLHPKTAGPLTYNPEENWNLKGRYVYLKSTARAQEFVFEKEEDVVKNWCLNLIRKNRLVE